MTNKMRQFLFLFLAFGYVHAFELRTGDIILQPLSCHACWLIEQEEGGPYSHMGVVMNIEGTSYVAEALHGVELTPLADFIKRPTQKRLHLVIRHLELEYLADFYPSSFLDLESNLIFDFSQNYFGMPYDHEFLWDNQDEYGRQKFYCSEMITKLMNPYLVNKVLTKKMHFHYNRDYWFQYFHGNIPDGLPGNSPMDYYNSGYFKAVGWIDNAGHFFD